MERIRSLNLYQKTVLVLLAVMALVFAGIYSAVIARTGFAYMGRILVASEEAGIRVYSGRLRGKECAFRVTPEKQVSFQWGEREYGPYTVRQDPTAVPGDHAFAAEMTGWEVREGEEIRFRGGALDWGNPGDIWLLVNEDGTDSGLIVNAVMSDGSVVDMYGNTVDQMEPSVADILELADGPDLTHKGAWAPWFAALVFSLVTAVYILFAQELFYWKLSFYVNDPRSAEPGDLEMAGRYIAWTVMPVMILFLYIFGLQ